MRVVMLGAGAISVATAEILLRRKHEVIIIERDRARIDELSEELDCAFIQGDGSKVEILREASPEQVDFLFCLTGHDQDNILASLAGRSLGYERIVTKIEDREYAPLCSELGLSDTIIPDQTIARMLADMVAGRDMLELSSLIKSELRFFSFVAREEDGTPVGRLELPDETRVVCIYREEDFILADADTKILRGDEVLLATHSRNLSKLQERWAQTDSS